MKARNLAKGWVVYKRDDRRVVYTSSGMIAGHVRHDNAKTIEVGKRYNGSGPAHFGGADEWPHVRLDVDFNVDEGDRANVFAEKLMAFVNDFFNSGGDS